MNSFDSTAVIYVRFSSHNQREEFQRMIKDSSEKKFRYLIVHKLDSMLESVIEGMAQYYSKNLACEVMKGLKESTYDCKHL